MNYYKTFGEAEAFGHAREFYKSLEGDFQRFHESRLFLQEVEETAFQPALELQVAGLCLLAGRPNNSIYLPVSFAFFIVDHMTVGWSALLASQFRVAYTLSRSIVEASIFEVASATNPNSFRDLWTKPKGTGGRVLKEISDAIPQETHGLLKRAWDMTKAAGHASFAPVTSSAQVVQDQVGKKIGVMTFGGPYIEPLNKDALSDLAVLYGLGAMVGVDAMKNSLLGNFSESGKWMEKYENLDSSTKAIAKRALVKLEMAESKGT